MVSEFYETGLIRLGCEVEILHRYFASLHATLDLQTASDSLAVLHTYATSLYVCLDSHLTILLDSTSRHLIVLLQAFTSTLSWCS